MASPRRLTHPVVLAGAGLLAAMAFAVAVQRLGPLVLVGLAAAGIALLVLDRPAIAVGGLAALALLLELDQDAIVPAPSAFYGYLPGPQVTGVEALLALGAGAALATAAARGRVVLPDPLTIPLLLLGVGVLAGVVTGKAAGASTSEVLQPARQMAPLLVLPFAVVNVVPDVAALKRWMASAAGLVVVKAAIGVLGIVAGLSVVFDEEEGVRATYLESTTNLMTMVFVCVVTAGALLRAKLPRWAVYATPLVLACLALSYRRSFWIGTTVSLWLLLLLGSGQVGRRLIVPAVLVVGVAAWALVATGAGGQVNGSVAERAGSLDPTAVQTNDQDRYRISERRNVLGQLLDHPVSGLGLGVAWRAEKPMPLEHEGGREYVHLAALWWWMKLGVLGLLGYLVLMGTAVFTGLRTWQRHADPLVRAAALGTGIAFVGLAIAELTATFSGSEVRTSIVAGVLLGLLAVARATASDRPPATAAR